MTNIEKCHCDDGTCESHNKEKEMLNNIKQTQQETQLILRGIDIKSFKAGQEFEQTRIAEEVEKLKLPLTKETSNKFEISVNWANSLLNEVLDQVLSIIKQGK
jgi:aspartyl/asparaginyl-tRNA synthetase